MIELSADGQHDLPCKNSVGQDTEFVQAAVCNLMHPNIGERCKAVALRLMTRRPLPELVSSLLARDVAIIMMHGLHDPVGDSRTNWPSSSTPVDGFARSCEALKQSFRFIALAEAVDMLCGVRPWRSRCVVLTFDDSLKCHVRLAMPLLKRLDIPASFYISTEAIDRQQPYWHHRLDYAVLNAQRDSATAVLGNGESVVITGRVTTTELRRLKRDLMWASTDRREDIIADIERQLHARMGASGPVPDWAEPLTWDDVRAMSEAGLGIGSHTVSHTNLAIQAPESVRLELIESRRRVEQEIGSTCSSICYPHGIDTPEVHQMACECGYRSGVRGSFCTPNRRGASPFCLSRHTAARNAAKATYVVSGMQRIVRSLRGGGLPQR